MAIHVKLINIGICFQKVMKLLKQDYELAEWYFN